ncbi:MAG: CDP-diacylglycerol--glycerol-3-phosphate 3-phosphatidyltransferase [Bacilli bacterium]|nr:CDP-diacylglycerol--glycerol-3-phosphate 3-phosphatidyltransferase [Bacilli bacterium]
MNLPNKITVGRMVISFAVLVLLLLPWSQLGVHFPVYTINGNIILNLKMLIAGGLFVVGSVTDFLDGHIARSRGIVTDFGKVMDAIADKILVNGVLIILAYEGMISIIIPVVIITRDTIVDSCKMISGNKGKVVAASIMGKLKTICMMVGLSLTMFYNLPFEMLGVPVARVLLIIATILSVISGIQYFNNSKELFMNDK